MGERDLLNIVGQVLAKKYRIEEMVGEGGFAVVYRATQVIWNKNVAIKFFSGLSSAPADQRDQLASAFVQEGALLTELSTETVNIVQARDVGTYTTPDGQWVPYMVLEWLDGEPLDSVLLREREQGKSWSLADVLALVGQVAGALQVAHKKGIAHRDIKPANLFIVPDGDSTRVKVLDFGVAKMMADNTQIKAAFAKTGMNVTSFTPQYGAPEQFNRSYGATGPWTDVYALALSAAEMLAGREALEGDDLVQLAFCSSNPERRPTPKALGADVPDAIEQVFAKALAVRPDDRYANAGEFLDALNVAMGGGVSATLRHSFALAPGFAMDKTELMPTTGTGPGTTSQGATVSQSSKVASSNTPLVLGGVVVVAALAVGGYFAVASQKGDLPAQAVADTTSAPAPAASSAPAAPEAPPSCPDGMALIPKGQFFMGSDAESARDNEKPAHNVSLDAFCIDLYEVTAKRYKACSDVGKCKRAPKMVEWPGISEKDKKVYAPLCTVEDEQRLEHPANCVSWQMADTFCKAEGGRLPTEAEWEYATRGPDGRVYPWGDEEPTEKHLNACGSGCMAWAKKQGVAQQFPGVLYDADDGYPTTAPVGKFPAGKSRFGPYDVVGNVWEWVQDWDGPYQDQPKVNPTGPETGEKRVIRGGAWNGSFASWLRPSFRFAQEPSARSHGVGFRCAQSLEPRP